MPDEGRQFRILYKDFLSRIVDVEILSSRGEIQKLLVQFTALLAAFSLVYVMVRVVSLARAAVPFDVLARTVRMDEEFLIATTMAVAGLFSVLAWNTVLPDRRDCLVLGLLPLRVRTIFFAKAAAIATGLGISIAALNSFTGLTVPFLAPAQSGVFIELRSLFSYWIVSAAAGLFVCASLIAVQGVAAHTLSYRLFLRISSWLQLGAFFTILGVYFLKPPFPHAAASAWLPSFWFCGLLEQMKGATDPTFQPLARRALIGLVIALTIAGASFALAYRRNIRRIIEQPDITPADRSRPAARAGTWVAANFLRKPIDRAVVLFIARTIARSRQHRLLLAAYVGIGLAISLAYMRDLIYGSSKSGQPFLVSSLVMLFFAIIGLRAVFALPISLPANWIFRMTAVHRPAAYFGAVRKALYMLAALPVWLVATAALHSVQHAGVMVALAVILVERSLARFHRFPFACSYLPGKANLQVRLGTWGMAFLFIASQGVQIEYWAMQRPMRFAVLFTILGVAAVRSWHRRSELAGMPHNYVQFEDVAPREVESLDLRRDSPWSVTAANG